jgi:hypothetical protein
MKIPLVTAFRLEYETVVGEDQIVGEAAVKSEYQQSLVTCKCKKGFTKVLQDGTWIWTNLCVPKISW